MILRPWLVMTFVVFFFTLVCCDRSPPQPMVIVESEPTMNALIATYLDGSQAQEVLFSDVIKSSSGKRVVPLDPNDEVDSQILDELTLAMNQVLAWFNLPDAPNRSAARINEMGPYLEQVICDLMNRAPGFSCDFARMHDGNLQRTGYPDLKLVHKPSGRIVYLETKLAESNSLNSNLKTFYYTPRGGNDKILNDAHHLMLTLEHDGNTGNWQFSGWHIIDLAFFKVRLKAEFHAENRDVYRPELTIRKGP